jgi:hypothetical protein
VASPITKHPGATHLAAIACEPRPAGGEAEGRAREYAAGVLRGAGFAVHEEAFGYSGFPGRYATPIGGALAGLAVMCATYGGLWTSSARQPILELGIGLAIVALFVRAMLGDAVLDLPLQRERSVNLVATRGAAAPRVWLVAHLDSKSQPLPTLARVIGIALLASSIVLALASALLQLAGLPHRMGWWGAIVPVMIGMPLVVASVVRAGSCGAVDNASGVATVLLAATRVRPGVPIGVLLPSAEELGLAGARAWARRWGTQHDAGIALNCDGVDDHGELTIMYSGTVPTALIETLRGVATPALRARRMPLGMLTDSVALADRGWTSATVSRGSVATLRRIHTSGDSLASLMGTGLDSAATLLARAAEALA